MNREELAALSGESEHIRPKPLVLPIVSLHGEKGFFRRMNVGKDGRYIKPAEDIGKAFSGVIVRVRMQLSEYSKKLKRSSNEYDTLSERVTVWKQIEESPRSKEMSGSVAELREQLPNLRSQRWLYMISKGQLVKFRLRGTGLTQLFDYFKKLKEMDAHMHEVVTSITASKEHNADLDKDFYKVNFEVSRVLSPEDIEAHVAPTLKMVAENIKATKAMYAQPEREVEEEEGDFEEKATKPLDEITAEDIPVIDLEDDVKAEDLPF